MKRRTFLPAAAGAGMVGMAAAAPAKQSIYEIRRYLLRNTTDNQPQRMSEYMSKIYLPAVQRAGAEATGCFGSLIAEQSPFVMSLASFPSLAAMAAAADKLAADSEYQKQSENFFSAPGLAFVRMETSLLRAFAVMPSIEVPSTQERQAPRIFELRTYESNSPVSLATKIRMFEEGEIAIFRRAGLQPVFFGETIAGTRMPNLTYMIAFDDLAARDKNWRTFGGDPEWQKLRAKPGYGDAEIVSNISNAILRPMPFSQIR